MARNDRLVNDILDTGTTVMTGIVAGTITPGNTLDMHGVMKGTLSAKFAVVANTATIQISALWEVSRDGVTWVEANPPWLLATGTTTLVTRAVDAPLAVYGYRYARGSVRNAVVDGLIADTYRISYSYQDDNLN
jgi:hypothetical protein